MLAARYSFFGTPTTLALVLAAGAASADDNSIPIDQSGTGSTLSVGQSRASVTVTQTTFGS